MKKTLLLMMVSFAIFMPVSAQTVVKDTGVKPDEMPKKAPRQSRPGSSSICFGSNHATSVSTKEGEENDKKKQGEGNSPVLDSPSSILHPQSPIPNPQSTKVLNPRLSKTSVLLIGDSMCDGLGSRFSDYAAKNGFELHTVIWYGSTSKSWATTYDLQYHIERVRPDYIIFSLGTNDLGYYDYARREGWIKGIIDKIGDIPYLWIGPLPWKKVRDRTIVDIIRRNTGKKHFYDSSNTYCQRLDGVHPTFPAAAKWVDDIVKWMGNPDVIANPVVLERPDRKSLFLPEEKHTPKYKGRRI